MSSWLQLQRQPWWQRWVCGVVSEAEEVVVMVVFTVKKGCDR